MYKIKWKPLIVCLAIPLLGGLAVGLITMKDTSAFASVAQPPLSPPGWLFPVVWTILYALMGIASYLVYTADAPYEKKLNALLAYAGQLFFNLLWSIWFFSVRQYTFAFGWLVILFALIWLTFALFRSVNRTAARLLIPYILWVAFAGYLNLGVAILNPA
ncbi:MAG: tryptophan-rich sensory protein [Clostridia bacterium]|nr:tryptophan-rich sensory protein [Clostridia bacterium]